MLETSENLRVPGITKRNIRCSSVNLASMLAKASISDFDGHFFVTSADGFDVADVGSSSVTEAAEAISRLQYLEKITARIRNFAC